MILSENRLPVFGILRWKRKRRRLRAGAIVEA